MTQSTKYDRPTLACYYSFRQSHILIGALDKQRRLILTTELTQTNMPVSAIASQILDYDLPTYINQHEPLKTALGGLVRGELNFDSENEIERQNLDDLYYSLKHENRMAIAPGVSLQGSTAQYCLKILLKGMLGDLCSERPNWEWDAGEVTELSKVLDQFETYF